MIVAALLRKPNLFFAVVAAQLADLLTFLPAVSRVGIGAEQNPLARGLFATLGAAGPAALKLGAIAVVLLVLCRIVVRFPAYSALAGSVVVAIGLIGAWSNVAFGLAR